MIAMYKNICQVARALVVLGIIYSFCWTTSFAQTLSTHEVIEYPSGAINSIQHETLLKISRPGNPTLEIGYGNVMEGTRLPNEGSVRLPVDDIGVMIQGRQIADIAGHEVNVNARQLIHVFPEVAQSAFYIEPTKLLYLFFGGTVDNPSVPNLKNSVDNNPSLKVWTAAELPQGSLKSPAASLTLLKADGMKNPTLQIGIARIPAGTRTPDKGDVSVLAHDIEVVLKGKAIAMINGQEVLIQAGDIIRIPPGTRHYGRFLEDTELVYIFYGEDVSALLVNK